MPAPPMNVICQTAEAELADTIKPRLTAMDADCSRVLVIDESKKELTLRDERLEKAILETDAGLIVLNPPQAYLGDGVDMHRAGEVRPVFKKLCAMAERTGCAVVLIGHLNKMRGTKCSYRGLVPSISARRQEAFCWLAAPGKIRIFASSPATKAVWLPDGRRLSLS